MDCSGRERGGIRCFLHPGSGGDGEKGEEEEEEEEGAAGAARDGIFFFFILSARFEAAQAARSSRSLFPWDFPPAFPAWDRPRHVRGASRNIPASHGQNQPEFPFFFPPSSSSSFPTFPGAKA